MNSRTLCFYLVLFYLFVFVIPINAIGQSFSGSGFYVNNSGAILTNKHVVSNGCSRIIVENFEQETFEAEISHISEEYDLALIKVDQKNKHKTYLRMTPDYNNALLPLIEEHVHTVGFPNGNFEPRGGFVEARSDPRYEKSGLTISLGTEPGASGSPVFDNNGLLVGILWGKSKSDEQFDMYALSAEAIIPFFVKTETPIGTSSVEEAPHKSVINGDFFQIVEGIYNYAIEVVVKVNCYN